MRWLLVIVFGVVTQMASVPADARTRAPTLDELLTLPLERLVRLRIDPAAWAATPPDKGGSHAP